MNKWVFTTDELIQKCLQKIEEVKVADYYSDHVKAAIIQQWQGEIKRLEDNRLTRGQP